MEEMRRHPELKDLAESTQVRLAIFFVCSFSDVFISIVCGWAMAIARLVEWCVLSCLSRPDVFLILWIARKYLHVGH